MTKKERRECWFAALRIECGSVRWLAAIGVIFLWTFLVFGITSHADENGAQLHKYYTSVLVIDEESLAEQVEEYASTGDYRDVRSYLLEVCRINHLAMRDADTLKVAPGNYVILPYYSSEIM